MQFVKKHFCSVFLLFLVSLISLKGLFHPGIYTAHDIWHNLARISYYFQAFSEGQFPPYFINYLANGFGYPLFLYSYHLPWIVSLPFLVFGLDSVTTIKILFFLSYFLSSLAMYGFIYELTKNKVISLASSFLYLWAPYRFFVIFVAASMGLSFSFIFAPLVFWGILKMQKGKDKKLGVILVSFGLSGIVLSHTPTLFVIIPTLLGYGLVLYLESKNKLAFVKSVFIAFLLTFLLSAFYLLPALYYKASSSGFNSIYKMGFVTLKQLIYSKWGYGVIINSASENPFSFQIGIAQWLILVFSVVYLISKARKFRNNFPLLVLVLLFFFNIFLATKHSLFAWVRLISHTGLDFPFRFIYPNVVVASILFALLMTSFKNIFLKCLIIVFLVAVALYTNRNHLKANMYLTEDIYTPFIKAEETTNTYDEYLPKGVDRSLMEDAKRAEILADNNLVLISENSLSSTYLSRNETAKEVVFPNYYYPYLHVYDGGNAVPIDLSPKGLVSAKISGGEREVTIVFRKSWVMLLANTVSIASFFGIMVWISANFKNFGKNSR